MQKKNQKRNYKLKREFGLCTKYGCFELTSSALCKTCSDLQNEQKRNRRKK